MPSTKRFTDILAESFLEKVSQVNPDIDPIKVLRARAYRIGNANFLIRAASLGKNGRYFFGLNYIHAEEVANLENAYFVFICGSLERTIIIPAPVLISNLSQISHDRNGEYKINIDSDFNLLLKGRNNRLACDDYVNNWEVLTSPSKSLKTSAEESFHSTLQGRLLEIGKIRGYQTFCPNKSKKFNGVALGQLATLEKCPKLQFSEYSLLRNIDVLWFREKSDNLIPEYAFEVEISTGTWSGVGRMATLIDYANTRLYVISDEIRKFKQVIETLSEYKERYIHIPTFQIGELYAAEKSLRELRYKIGL